MSSFLYVLFGWACGLAVDVCLCAFWRVRQRARGWLLADRNEQTPSKPSKFLPVVLVHGSNGFGSQWTDFRRNLDDAFASQPFACYPVELPKDADASINVELLHALGQHVDAVIKASGHSCVSLVGHSLGGLVAARFAIARPDVVAAVVTLGTPWKGVPLLNRLACLRTSVQRCEMCSHSTFLNALNARWSKRDLHLPPVLCIRGAFDVQVPESHAYHDSALVSTPLCTHLTLLTSKRVAVTVGVFLASLTNATGY